MKNNAKRASALVLLLLPLFCGYVTTMGFPGRLNTWNVRSLQSGRRVAPKEATTQNRGLKGPLPLIGMPRSLASQAITAVPNNTKESECRLSPAILAQITKPSASEWLIDDDTVKLLKSNLQELIRCTKPFDKVIFNTQAVISVTETLKIIHELEFLRIPETTLESKYSDANTTVFTCPKSSPVFSVNASSFTATGFTIANCTASKCSGTIIVHPKTTATLKHFRIEDNKIRGVRINTNTTVTFHDAYFANNEVFGHGGAIYAERDAYITITDSTFIGNTVNEGYGGAIFLASSDNVVINGSLIAGNSATLGGSGLALVDENTLNMFESEVSNNNAVLYGGALNLGVNNSVIMHKVVVSGNDASGGGAMCINGYNHITMVDCAITNGTAYYGGAMAIYKNNILTLINCVLTNDTAVYGGALFIEHGNSLTIIDSVLSENFGQVTGGAIEILEYNNAVLRGCVLSNNNAPSGGALWANVYNNATIVDSILSNNHGEYNTKYGEGLYLNDTSNLLVVKNSTISKNNANGDEARYPYSALDVTIETLLMPRREKDDAKHAESVV